jgi:hypothetical protein
MMLSDVSNRAQHTHVPIGYFVPPGFALVSFGEGDVAAGVTGEGVAEGLAAGVVVAGTAGEAEVAGAVVVGVFELLSVSAHAAAKAIETVATRSSAARLMKLMFENFMVCPQLEQD